MRTVHIATWLVTGFLAAGVASAEERGTPKEAQALLERAVALVESEGEEKGTHGE